MFYFVGQLLYNHNNTLVYLLFNNNNMILFLNYNYVQLMSNNMVKKNGLDYKLHVAEM